jgi:hypothetical protein
MSTIYKFRARMTDGSSLIVKGMSTGDSARVKAMALQIARRDNVQSVKVLAIPNRER